MQLQAYATGTCRRAIPSAFDVSGLVNMGAPPPGAPPPAAPLMRWSTEAPGPRLPPNGRPQAVGGRGSGRPSTGAVPAPGGSRLLASLVRAPGSGGGGFAAARTGLGAAPGQGQGGASLIDSLESAMEAGRPLPAAPVLAQAPASAPQRFAGAPRQALFRSTQHASASGGAGPSRGPALRPGPDPPLRPASGTAWQPACAPAGAGPSRVLPAPGHAWQPYPGHATPPASRGAQAGPAAGALPRPQPDLAAPSAAPKESVAEYMARLKQELEPDRFARIEALLRAYKAVRHPSECCQPQQGQCRPDRSRCFAFLVPECGGLSLRPHLHHAYLRQGPQQQGTDNICGSVGVTSAHYQLHPVVITSHLP